MSAVDRTPLYVELKKAQFAKQAAEQAINDAYTALRLCGWGKIEKATWQASWESNDEGGSYISVYGTYLHIDGESYPVGATFDDIYPDDIEEGSAVELLMQKYKLAGTTDIGDTFRHALAELAEISLEDFGHFTSLAYALVEDDKEKGELLFTH